MPVITKKVGQSIMIEADDLVAFDPNGGLELWANSISGSFTEPRGVAPCSILINRGVDICSYSCHAWLGYPEAVIYRYKDGTFGCGKFMYTKQIPNRGDVLWAVGGMGLGPAAHALAASLGLEFQAVQFGGAEVGLRTERCGLVDATVFRGHGGLHYAGYDGTNPRARRGVPSPAPSA